MERRKDGGFEGNGKVERKMERRKDEWTDDRMEGLRGKWKD